MGRASCCRRARRMHRVQPAVGSAYVSGRRPAADGRPARRRRRWPHLRRRARCPLPANCFGSGTFDACFLVGTDVTVPSGTSSVTGTRPLVLLATGTVTVTGTLDVASHSGSDGAGANSSACDPGFAPQDGAGGGAGGSFGTKGGDGC